MKISEYDEKELDDCVVLGETAQNHAAMTTKPSGSRLKHVPAWFKQGSCRDDNHQRPTSLQPLFYLRKTLKLFTFFLRHLRITLHTYIP